MKKILLFLLLLPALLFAQNQGGVIIVGGVAVHQPDTSAYKVINTIQAEGTALSGNNRFYVTYLVAISKRDSLWQKSKAFYGFIGGTSASHKWNWKDMRDLDVAFRLQFFNSPTHNSSGVLWNGTTQYANTFLNPTISLSATSTHLSYYTPTNNINDNPFKIPIGALETTSGGSVNKFLQINLTSANYLSGLVSSIVSYTPTKSNGYTLGTKISDNNQSAFFNRVKLAFSNVSSSVLPNIPLYIGARNRITVLDPLLIIDGYSPHTASFSSIGSGLTDQQATQASNTVIFAQGILGRK